MGVGPCRLLVSQRHAVIDERRGAPFAGAVAWPVFDNRVPGATSPSREQGRPGNITFGMWPEKFVLFNAIMPKGNLMLSMQRISRAQFRRGNDAGNTHTLFAQASDNGCCRPGS